jgi:predicted transglutaminase-like cysteine proteinase
MRRFIRTIAAISVLAGLFGSQQADAGFVGMPKMLGQQYKKIAFGGPTLPPFAHTLFCTRYPAECVPRRIIFRGGLIALTAERKDELLKVNAQINGSIVPKRNTEGFAGKGWQLSPKTGDCNDYAVTKRHELLERGWPSRALLLAEVVTTWGEHHLVLVVRTRQGDVVADNLSQDLKPWTRTPYRWIRIQSPETPSFWSHLAPA